MSAEPRNGGAGLQADSMRADLKVRPSITVFIGEAVREAFDPKEYSRLR